MPRRRQAVGILVAAAALMLILPAATAQPTPGAWIVSTHETYEDQTLDVKGNILIQDGGTLELVRSTLVMNATPPAEPIIRVEGGGKLILNGSRERATLITDGPFDDESGDYPDLDFHYLIRVERGGVLEGRNCNLTDMGRNYQYHPEPPRPAGEPRLQGLSVLGGTLWLSDCVLNDSHSGIFSREGEIYLENYRHVPGSRYDGPAWSGNFDFDGGIVRIVNSAFTYHSHLDGIDGFEITNTSWISHLPDRAQGGFLGCSDCEGVLENVTIHGQSSSWGVSGNASVTIRNSTIMAGERGIDLGLGPEGQTRVLVLENVRIHDMTPPPGFGAISVRGGYSHAKVIAMNTTITDIQGPSLLVWGGQEAVLRNVTFDQRRIEIEDGVKDGVSINTEGLLRLTASHAGDGSPLAGVHVELEQDAAGDRQTATTGRDGQTILWVPAETYDEDAGRFIPVDPDGWTVTITHEDSELVHTVPWTAQAAHIAVVWDAGDGLQLAGEEGGGTASLPWWSAAAGLLVAVGLWRRRARMSDAPGPRF